MKVIRLILPALCLALTASMAAASQSSDEASGLSGNVPDRVVDRVDDSKLVALTGEVHPSARPEFDKGRVNPNLMLERIVLVLQRSPEQEAALAAFNERQYDPNSPDFHRWLHAEEFGSLYGPSDDDIAAGTSWLQNHGFSIFGVGKGRVWIQFTGTAAQVEDTFHVEMHNYLVGGKMHIANDRNPQIPAALKPVITGIASLNDFFPKHYSHPGNYVKRNLKTGKYELMPSSQKVDDHLAGGQGGLGSKGPTGVRPAFGYIDSSTGYQREELSPYDVATIYNILPLWNASTPINGKGVKVAIVALSDVEASDLATYRSSFGLPSTTLETLHSGADPGITASQGENTEDTEMVSATAPGATIELVADVDNATTDGLVTAITYIVDNEVAPVLTMSYGECELKNGTAANALFNNTFQQAATAGISSFVAAGDSGSAVCTSQDGTPPYADTYGLAVSGMADSPYVTAVGGTDLQWPFASLPYTTYWNTTNNSKGASAKGYMPEMSWNDTCSNPLLLNVYTSFSNSDALCNAAITEDPGLVEMAAGSGGKSNCTTPTGTTPSSCAGGYAKPSWQRGVIGIPNDGKRDLPDVSMFAAYGFQNETGIPGSALLICMASASPTDSCDYSSPEYIIYQENGGTSAASPMTAGIMAMVLQKTGAKQGLANPVFYSLAATENYADCNSNTVKAGNTCIFYDTTTGSNAMVCADTVTNCVVQNDTYDVGILTAYSATEGYDLTTGLGTFNVANLVNAWASATSPTVTLSPTTLTFASTTVGSTTAAQVVTVKNSGGAALTLTSETLTGTNSSSFLISAKTCGSSLAAGASCTVSVEFKPAATGSLSASLSIADNATGSPQTVSLKGTGAASTKPTLSVTPTSLAFPDTVTGAVSDAQQVTIQNTGTITATLTTIALGGTDASSFKQLNTCGATLAAGSSCAVYVAFKPASAASLTGTLSVTDNATGSPQTVSLKGTGTAAPSVKLSVTSIAFPTTKHATTSAAKSVTLTNGGAATLTLTSITLTGTNPSDFTELNTCGATLAPSASCIVYVAFTPAAVASYKATLSIADNGASSPQSVALTGTGD